MLTLPLEVGNGWDSKADKEGRRHSLYKRQVMKGHSEFLKCELFGRGGLESPGVTDELCVAC